MNAIEPACGLKTSGPRRSRALGPALVSLLSAASGCIDTLHADGHYRDPDGPGPATRIFFVRPSGDDANSGEDPFESWRSLARVNEQDLEPGDQVLLEAGASFAGTLRLEADDSGSARDPVRIGSFGDGRATIDAGDASAIEIADAAGLEIEGLLLIGDWDAQKQSGNSGEGVSAKATQSGQRQTYLRLRGLEVSGFKLAGIALHAQPEDESKNSGFDDVVISDCSVHDNGDFGLLSDGPFTYDDGYSHARVQVRRVYAYSNRGLVHKGAHTGSGIVLSDVEDAVIEGSIAHDNGEFNDHMQGGGFGIWAWDATRVTIQYNESYRNRTQTVDGGGFDLDGGVTQSVMRYNYSHDNAGAGFGSFQFSGARPFSDNLIQYNISQDDGFAFLIWDGNGDMGSLALAQNTGYGAKPSVMTYSAVADALLLNNIFFGTGERLLDIFEASGLKFGGNVYWSGDAALQLVWNDGTGAPLIYDSLEAFRSDTGQEMADGDETGLNVDPQLIAAGTGGTLEDAYLLGTLGMYRLSRDSPLIDRGVDPRKLDLTLAERDFFGNPTPRGAGRDIGAHEAR